MQVTRRKLLQYLALIPAGALGLAAFDEVWNDMPEMAIANMFKPGSFSDNGTAKESSLVPLVYHPKYNISAFGLEKLHPFDGKKFASIHKHLIQTGLRKSGDFRRPTELSQEQLLTVHSQEYLDSLSSSDQIARIMEVVPAGLVPSPLLDWRILKPMRLASGGTRLACETALDHGLCINIGGGYHHAHSTAGGGFCVYSDVPIALALLRKQGRIKNALIVDTDAHQGNGFATEACKQKQTHVLDLFEENIYPFPKVKEDMSVPFAPNTDGATYLATLRDMLPVAIARYEPDLIVYNAGSDVLATDPLSSFRITVDEFVERDTFVINEARKQNIPVAMVLAGGYGSESALAHAKSIEEIVRTHDSKRLSG